MSIYQASVTYLNPQKKLRTVSVHTEVRQGKEIWEIHSDHDPDSPCIYRSEHPLTLKWSGNIHEAPKILRLEQPTKQEVETFLLCVLRDTVDEFTDLYGMVPVHASYSGTEFQQALHLCPISRYLPVMGSKELAEDVLTLPVDSMTLSDFQTLALAFLEEHLIDCIRPMLVIEKKPIRRKTRRKPNATP